MRRLALGALALLACDPVALPDAGADAGPGGLTVALEAPAFGFVDEEVCLRAVTTGAVRPRYEWNLGDGTALSTEEPTTCHRYATVGPRTVGVTARDGARTAEAVASLAVVFEPSDPRPTASSPIAYDALRDRVWVVNPDADSVAVIDAGSLTLERELTALCGRPRTLAVGGSVVMVACQGSGELRPVDAETLEPGGARSLGVGSEPYGVLADPRGGGFFAATRDGRVHSVDAAATERAVVDVGAEPRGLAMRADGALLVTRWRSTAAGATVSVVDASDPNAPSLVGPTRLPPEGDDSDTDNRGVLSFLNQVVFTPDGARAFVPALKANVVTGAFLDGRELTSQTTARAAFAEVLVGRPTEPARDSLRHSFDDLDYASAVVFTPLGDRAFFAMQGAQTVVLVDAFDFFSVGNIREVGEAPQGLALSPDGTRLFVQAFLSRSVRVYDVTDLAQEPAPLAEITTVSVEPLAPEVLAGKRVFYRSRDPRMSRTGYLSCASCHQDGEGDGLIWDFTQRGEGLRNTASLRGRAGAPPLHWTGNFDEVQDFEHDIRVGQGGTGFLDDAVFGAGGRDAPLGGAKAGLSAELDALAAYVTSLSEHGASPARQDADYAAAAAGGEALFRDPTVGCAGCHAGPAYTDSAFVAPGTPRLHDVGTLAAGSGSRLGEALTGLDTPTLRGLWRTAPYLHDGSAATLRDVLTVRNPSDRHGVTSGLDDAQLADLEAFLRGLDDAAP